MKIWLLTHSEELKKESGTGKLVKEILTDQCHIIIWARKEPNQDLLALDPLNTAIVYLKSPTSLTLEKEEVCHLQNIIILDGTWQQARKMYNQSPYLARFPHYEIQGESSAYTKRRNQKEAGLCTAEVAIHLLKEANDPQTKKLQARFSDFNLSP
jgi:DTW domain-containing protein YfiP